MSDNSVLFTRLINAPLWELARWSATAFQFHPTGECPPVLGIVFENAEAGREIFSGWVDMLGNDDQFEEIRVSIIEGKLPGKRAGYAVHICPDPVGVAARATSEGIVLDPTVIWLGRLDRMYPRPECPSQLPRFKKEFERHNEYLLAPMTKRSDDKLWTDVELGVVKSTIHFRDIADVARENDLDNCVLQMPSR